MKKAAFYQGTVVLIPEEFEDLRSFQKEVELHPLQVLVTLNEKECLVPYFIEEHCEIKTMMISHPDELIEVEVEVLKQKEYDRRLALKLSEMKMDEENVSRFRQSLTLDGLFLKESSPNSYHEAIRAFWDDFGSMQKSLSETMSEKCMQCDQLRLLFKMHCGIPYSQFRVYVRKFKHKNVMMVTCLADSLYQILVDAVVHQSPKEYRESWDFYGYLPRAIYQYVPSSEQYDASIAPCTLVAKKTQFDHLRYDIEIEIASFSNFPHACEENYLYMCSILGENMFHAIVNSFSWTAAKERKGISVNRFFQQLMASFQPSLLIQLTGHMHQIGLRLKKQESFSERSFEQHIMTRCVECTDWFVLEKQSTDISLLQIDQNIVFSTLVFQLNEEEERELQQKHILIDLVTLLVENTSIEIIDYCISEKRIDVDFMCFDSAQMFNVLYHNAPLFEKYQCRYDEHTSEGTEHYEVSYQMRKQDLKFHDLH